MVKNKNPLLAQVTVLTVGDYEKAFKPEWGFHTAKVNCVAWAPNSLYVASGGLDCSLIIWSMEAPDKHCIIRNSHDQVTLYQDSFTYSWVRSKTEASPLMKQQRYLR
jgi:WD40 repeat protein